MREIHPELQAKLDSGATTLCRAWLLQRQDGLEIGFTDHDRNLSFDGKTFEAGSGLNAAAIESGIGLAVDNTQAIGALSAAGLSEEDVLAGKYDRASVWQWIVDWSNTDLRVLMFRGYIGEISRGSGAFEAELRGLADDLNQTVGQSYLNDCPRQLGDSKCNFDVSAFGYSVLATVVEVESKRRVVLAGVGSIASGWFEHGRGVWKSGGNLDLASRVKFDEIKNNTRCIEFWLEAPFAVQIGDTLLLEAGCDKRPETCKLKFNNLVNYRGFPHMPGEDWVASYPSGNDIHDGTSRYR
jgi:uncharacterized phage protein (TIGR02218 family)